MPLNIDFIKYLLKCSNKAPEPGPFLILANMKMCMSLVIGTALGLVHTSVTHRLLLEGSRCLVPGADNGTDHGFWSAY